MTPPAMAAVGEAPAWGAAVPPGTASPDTAAAWGGTSPETEVAVVGIGAAGQPPRPGRRAGHRGTRRRGVRPAWAAAAAVALVFAGVAGTYLVMSGPAPGKSAGPLASPLVAATKTRPAALAGDARPAGGHRASPGPSASATTPSAQPTASRAAAPNPTGAPAGNPGPTGPNLVADGDFTDASLSAWDNQVLNAVVVSSGQDGGYAAQMNGEPTAGVSQIVTGLKPGTTYELTGWIISKTGGSTYVGIKAYDSTAGVSRAVSSTSWTEVTMTMTEGAGHTTAEVFCWQAVAGIGYCTNVSLRALS
jgi:hypothetical protein